VIAESTAISRYAAKLANLYPADPLEALFVDEVVEIASDVIKDIPHTSDPQITRQLCEDYADGKLRVYFICLSDKLQSTTGPYLFGFDYNLADLWLYAVLKHFRLGRADFISAGYDAVWPVFQEFIDALEADPVFALYKL
jgi:glutathione S-transferase